MVCGVVLCCVEEGSNLRPPPPPPLTPSFLRKTPNQFAVWGAVALPPNWKLAWGLLCPSKRKNVALDKGRPRTRRTRLPKAPDHPKCRVLSRWGRALLPWRRMQWTAFCWTSGGHHGSARRPRRSQNTWILDGEHTKSGAHPAPTDGKKTKMVEMENTEKCRI